MEVVMEDVRQNWLIAILGVVGPLPHGQTYDVLDIGAQYLNVLATMDQEAALQVCGVTGMTTEC
ncbi:hypothetical protein B0H14DRAFT_3532117 [Mycena olivaceomarginata]|nr:hypothetical protein B0H14DRAFT_3532117 [Mycena olivaceomarginata]